MAAGRATWSGHVRVSLVSFAVKIFTASNPGRQIALHQIHKPSGQRIRYQKVVPELGPVDTDEIVKGYEYRKGEYVTLEPDEIAKVRLESKHTIDVVQFVDLHEIDPIYYDKPYFMVPDDPVAAEAFAVVREALKRSKSVGLGEVVLSGKEHLVAIRPCGKGMMLDTLRYADEVKKAQPYFEEIPDVQVNKDEIELAEELIKRKKGKLDLSKFSDSYEDALRELIAAKVEDQPLEEERPRQTGQVIDLMDALKRSLGQGGGNGSGGSGRKAPAAKKAAAKKSAPATKQRKRA